MKTIILCGGEGTRMKEETEFKPKPLVEVGGKPILWHIMKIYAYYGYNEFILALGYKGNMIKDYFLNWRTFANDFTLGTRDHSLDFHNNGHDDFKITFVDTGQKTLTGERLRLLKDYIDGDQFMLTYGDGVADIDIRALVDFHNRQKTIGTITGVRPLTRYGIVHHDEDSQKITGFKQNLVGDYKQKWDQHDFIINGGFMVFQKSFIDRVQPNSMVEESFIPLAKQGQMSLYLHEGKWKSMDTYKEVEELNEHWKIDPFWKIWERPPVAAASESNPVSSGEIPVLSFSASAPQPITVKSLMNTHFSAIQYSSGGGQAAPRNLAGKNVLVTGGTGLVGGHLVEKLLRMGANVFCTVRSKNPKSYFYQNKFDEKTVTVNCDITDAARVFDVVSRYEIEYIFHVAAQPIVTTSFVNPHETFATNIMGTVNILEAARKSPYIKGVIIASSDKAYGKDCVNVTEDHPLAGDHPYDVSKSTADLIARAYHSTYNLPVAVSRFGNIFGPGDLNFNRIVPGIIKSIFSGDKLEIRSDGKFVRDYIYVKDVVNGYILLAQNIEKAKGQAFNFSAGYNFSVVDFIRKVSEIVDRPVPYTILNNQKNEIPFQSLNYQKAVVLLGWQPEHTLEDGIRETFLWYRDFFEPSMEELKQKLNLPA